jgi:hypothetical protein
MSFSIENAESFIAPYLTRERRVGFLAELRAFPDVKPIYASIGDPEPLQGDCWSGVPVFDFESGQRKAIRAILVSNSCDASNQNSRLLPAKLTFAPVVALQRYAEALLRGGVDQRRVDDHLADIRGQRVSSLFFLPAGGRGIKVESVAILDDLQTVPSAVIGSDGSERLSSLSDLGFWLFLFKLSYHFCRMHENVDRTPQAT